MNTDDFRQRHLYVNDGQPEGIGTALERLERERRRADRRARLRRLLHRA